VGITQLFELRLTLPAFSIAFREPARQGNAGLDAGIDALLNRLNQTVG
jgi:hypothetical protein